MSFSLHDSVSVLKGVGKARLEDLQKAGITTLFDLIHWFPRRYRSGKIYPIGEDRVQIPSMFSLTAVTTPSDYTLPGKRRLLRFTAKDEDGNKVQILYFNQPYLKRQISKGDHTFYFGTLQEKSGVFYLFSPIRQKEAPDPDGLMPEYATIGNIGSGGIEKLMAQCLIPCLSQIPETLPNYIVEKFKLFSRAKAIFILHSPTSENDLKKARERILFENLFSFSVKAALFAEQTEKSRIKGFQKTDLSPFLSQFPFPLTGAQQRVIGEIYDDMISSEEIPPMNRLIQGDVGSGKTAVAAAAVYLCMQNNTSSLIMAPTEILALQHFHTFSRLFANFSVPVMLLTGSTPKKEREKIFQQISKKEPYILIGTHALTEETVQPKNISLTITDEQHRFGVRQRTILNEKGMAVHSLVMSATPIPRSLAMFLHAKKRISVIDELPPGRKTVETLYVGEDKLSRIYRFLSEKIALGQQAYLVCPLIEDEEDKSDLPSVTEAFEELKNALPEISSALLHGKMKNEEKDRILENFRQGKIQILVSTTVIEVGIDVPKATVMVIRSAERFGLSQLHQLRGRVGRSATQSYCILVSSHSGKNARERLKKLCDCHDGFELAKFDLEKRGPGEFFGTRQSGFGTISPESLSMPLLEQAGEAARLFLETADKKDVAQFEKQIGFN